MWWNFCDLYGGHYSRPLRRYWLMPLAPYAVLAANAAIAAIAYYGCRRGTGLVPWMALGGLKVLALIAEATWGAIGKYYVYIGLVVVAHWAVFVLLAYIMFLQAEMAGPKAGGGDTSTGRDETMHSRERGGDGPGSSGGGGGYGSYSAGSVEERKAVTLWLTVLKFVPFAGGTVAKTERRVKAMQWGV